MFETHRSRRLFIFAVISVFAITLFSSPVLAASDSAGIICGGNENVERIFRYMIGVFMALGFLFGIFIWAAEKFETSILNEGDFQIFGGLGGQGNEALKSAVLLPVVIYFFDLIDVMLFGIEISCIVPKP